MPHPTSGAGLFPALLKHWRNQRGLSQLDLSLVADVSSRHISFLETGRSSPSPEMVVRLAKALHVPLRHVNAMLRAAHHPALYPEHDTADSLPPAITQAIALMKQHHEPFPLIVIDRAYDIIDANQSAVMLFIALLNTPPPQDAPLNLLRMTFAPGAAQERLVNFEEIGREVLWRAQRELLEHPDDDTLRTLLEEVMALPTIGTDWREVDLTRPSSPVIEVQLRATRELTLRFVTMVTAFQTPQSVLLDELRIETWLPIDPPTADFCHTLVNTQE